MLNRSTYQVMETDIDGKGIGTLLMETCYTYLNNV